MALSLENTTLTKQRCLAETRKPDIQALLKAFFSHLAQHKGNPQLQATFFSALAGTDVVAADAACKLYAWYIKKPTASTTAAYVKASNHASALDEADDTMHVYLPTNEEVLLVFPNGIAMSTGFTIGSNTTASGTGASAAADQPSGFVIVGAP
jgi:hypothetical protein